MGMVCVAVGMAMPWRADGKAIGVVGIGWLVPRPWRSRRVKVRFGPAGSSGSGVVGSVGIMGWRAFGAAEIGVGWLVL